jgi:O-antigen ligase
VWSFFLAVLLEGLMLSFSRGSWLAFLVAAGLLVWLESRGSVARGSHPGSIGRAAVPLFIGALLALLISAYWDQVNERLVGEARLAAQMLEDNPERLQYSSIGIRLLGWRYGIEEWRRHPWFGLGAGTSRHRIAASGRPELLMYEKYWLPHLHNTYLEILYQLGLVGLILLAAITWMLVKGTVAEHRAGRLPGDIGRFLLATLVFVLLWNLFEYRAVRHDWQFFWIIFAGSAYSFHLRTLLRSAPAPPNSEGREPRP